MPDYVHMLLSIPPKYSVAQVIGFIKDKSIIHIARSFVGRRTNFTGQHNLISLISIGTKKGRFTFWARGYFVSTVGRDETTSRRKKKGIEESIS